MFWSSIHGLVRLEVPELPSDTEDVVLQVPLPDGTLVFLLKSGPDSEVFFWGIKNMDDEFIVRCFFEFSGCMEEVTFSVDLCEASCRLGGGPCHRIQSWQMKV